MTSYQDYLRNRIIELRQQIEHDTSEKAKLIAELQRLEKEEFEEDLREEGNQMLLNEQQGRLF